MKGNIMKKIQKYGVTLVFLGIISLICSWSSPNVMTKKSLYGGKPTECGSDKKSGAKNVCKYREEFPVCDINTNHGKTHPYCPNEKKDQYEIRVTVKSTIKGHDTFKCGCKLYKCAKTGNSTNWTWQIPQNNMSNDPSHNIYYIIPSNEKCPDDGTGNE